MHFTNTVCARRLDEMSSEYAGVVAVHPAEVNLCKNNIIACTYRLFRTRRVFLKISLEVQSPVRIKI